LCVETAARLSLRVSFAGAGAAEGVADADTASDVAIALFAFGSDAVGTEGAAEAAAAP
jgi:hypothetical protein